MDIYQWAEDMRNNKDKILKQLSNTNRIDVIRLRNEAAEAGIEMTIAEVEEHLDMIKQIVSE